MKKEAFGEIGLLPFQFYQMAYKDYILMQSGFSDKRKYERKVLRTVAKRLLEPYLKKGSVLKDSHIWVEDDDIDTGKEVSEKALARLQQFKNNKISYILKNGVIVEQINPNDN